MADPTSSLTQILGASVVQRYRQLLASARNRAWWADNGTIKIDDGRSGREIGYFDNPEDAELAVICRNTLQKALNKIVWLQHKIEERIAAERWLNTIENRKQNPHISKEGQDQQKEPDDKS